MPAPQAICISDLDGTLLGETPCLSEYTIHTLRELIAQGVVFSVATARTWESCRRILEPILPLPVPIVLMNGVVIFDTAAGCYIKIERLPADTTKALVETVRAHRQSGFLYTLHGEDTCVYHEPLRRPALVEFARVRRETYNKRFIECDDLSACCGERIHYFTTQDTRPALEPLRESLQRLPGIHCVLYPDSYQEGNWYLECFHANASKKTAVEFLRNYSEVKRVIGFGDNLNDIPLFEACDEGYAVANARPELKERATGVIGANVEDGVARYLARTMNM